ncbi:syntaxin-22 [Brachypodium distachyon]|uniref:Syntaxin N-terminal domain-containing protein n=1 Tax=Brachypodium distachyon TaxID=15368 RepID=I1GZM6_BRADI|nr:syntaxin-22 [Brachypodium distachyon]KQK18911.1 hypothetical protein BRADI_1g45430v3 [Brachypodium distachyon]|eukprot:XP_003560895.1 syntaxin-22 [Brachypodium distachyon]
MSFQDLEAGTLRPPAPAPLPQVVAHGVFQIHTKAAALRQLGDALGTPKETPALRARLRATQAEATRLAKTTSQNLKQGNDNNSIAPGSKLAMDFEAAMRELLQVQQRVRAAERRVQLQLQQRRKEEQELLAFSVDGGKELAEVEEERDQGIREVDQVIAELDAILGELALAALADDDDQGGGGGAVGDHGDIERTAETTSRAEEEVSWAAEVEMAAPVSPGSSSSTKCLLLAAVGLILFIFLVVLV